MRPVQQDTPWRLGVIEGFFGRPWSWQARADHAAFLNAHGFSTYIYAAKNDDYFRKRWHEPCPDTLLEHLIDLRGTCRAHKVEFGIGLSPLELSHDLSGANIARLQSKLDQINEVDPDVLCILFDDMRGDRADLATSQLEIVDLITGLSTARHFILCPTYYSSDPVLERVFGAAPQNYLATLGRALDPDIDIFWTGPKVISEEYPRVHLQRVAETLRRRPVLWDNYPVNDAERMTDYLHLLPFENRGPELRELCAGHMSNPMNQAHLSQIPLFSLPLCYVFHDTGHLLQQACQALCPQALGQALQSDAEMFQYRGLKGMSAGQRRALEEKYKAMAHPMADEVVGWLRGDYAFDPACLT